MPRTDSRTTHRREFESSQTRGGCIVRQLGELFLRSSDGIHRPQFGSEKSEYKLTTVGGLRMVVLVHQDEPTLATSFRPPVNPWERRLILGKTEETTVFWH